MRTDPRKIAAATVAVLEYLKEEQRVGRQADAFPGREVPIPEPGRQAPVASLWAAHGRTCLMDQRVGMQLGLFRKS
jgi:hypothetical protein